MYPHHAVLESSICTRDETTRGEVNYWEELGLHTGAAPAEVDAAWSRHQHEGTATTLVRRAWKLLRDPDYAHLYDVTGSFERCVAAGWFDDGADAPPAATRWMHADMTPVIVKLDPSPTRPLVLVSTGGFAPLHEGHLAMLERAREAATTQGYTVVAGYLSPCHATYVDTKVGMELLGSTDERLELLRQAVDDSDWLHVGTWEAHGRNPLNFTDVLRLVRRDLDAAGASEVELGYVFGSDNADFADVFALEDRNDTRAILGICVKRAGAECGFERTQARHETSGRRVLFTRSALQTPMASTPLRLSLRRPSSPQQPDGAENTEPGERSVYAVRDDVAWACSSWADRGAGEALNYWRAGLHEALSAARKDSDVVWLNVERQRSQVVTLESTSRVLNLDVVTGSGQVGVSRIFEMGSSQNRATSMTDRPGSKSFFNLPPGNYLLVDDDISSGTTMNWICSQLPGDVHVTGRISLLDTELAAEGLDSRPVADVVDARDFLPGASAAGLVVANGRGLVRVPYAWPYVNLTSRARIDSSKARALSWLMWTLAEQFYRQLDGPPLLLKDADPSFAAGMRSCGFCDTDTLADVCLVHLQSHP